MMSTGNGKKAIIAALLANIGVAIMKFIAFVFTGAASLMAESIHSAADSSNQLLLLLGANRSRKKPTPEHPFGYGPERFFWSFVVALVLFSLGGLFALFEGVNKLFNPHELESPMWGFLVLGVAIILEGFSLRTAIIETNQVRERKSFWKFIRTAKQPELPIILLEDFGAMIGLLLALAGLSTAVLTSNVRYDAIGSISIGLLLVVIAFVLAREMKSLLIGEAVDTEVAEKIRTAIFDGNDVKKLIHMRTLHHGPDNILLCIKVELSATNAAEMAQQIDTVEKRIRDAVNLTLTIYVEPDIMRSAID